MGLRKHHPNRSRRYLRYTCRCSRRKCQARRTFKVHPDYFKQVRRCYSCGGKRWRVDWYRMVPERKNWMKPCRCAAAHYPHRLSWCSTL